MSAAPEKKSAPLPNQDLATETLDKTPPHGMKSTIDQGPMVSPRAFLVIAAMVLMTAVLIAGILRFIEWRRRKTIKGSSARDVAYEPGAWALLRDMISNIKAPGGIAADDDKAWNDFSSEVSLCLRRGLELRTGLPLAESTTEEIMGLLARQRVELIALSDVELRDILKELDRIRFGGHRISPAAADGILISLRSWIDKLESGQKSLVDAKGGVHVFDS